MSRRLALLALALVGATACSSTSTSGGTAAGTSTTAAATTTSVAASTTTTPSTTVVTTVVATLPPTVPPAPPVTNAPKPPASTAAPTPSPRLDSVSLKAPLPSCNQGDVLTITIEFSGTNYAAVRVNSSFDGDLGQYPAEYGSVDVLHTCTAGQTTYTLTPVAEGGALGTPLDLYV